MNRFARLLFLLVLFPAHAEPLPPKDFDGRLATAVYATALTFMAPRTLEPVPLPQLAMWGLRGLAALDPELSVGLSKGTLVLAHRDRIIDTRPLPATEAAQTWGEIAAALAARAWEASAAVRAAGTEGVVQSFFDELFNHLDPYSRYVGPGDAAEDRALRGDQAGAGLAIATRGTAVVVTAAVPDGPGADAGIRPGDRLVAVDGQPAQGQDAAIVGDWLAGAEGTLVAVTWRSRDGRTRSATLERAATPPETVFAERAGGLLLIRVTAFSRRTGERLLHEIDRSLAAGSPLRGLVLDLRGNRGGLLRQAVATADVLLPPGIVATTAGRDPNASHVWRSAGDGRADGLPVVVVVDGRTASAAEVVAAALADRGRAVVVGSSTLGKGLVQTIAPLPDGGELFVTWSRILAPLGWPIQGLGVLPQVCTSLGEQELARELRALDAGQAPLAKALDRHNRARAPIPVAEVLAIRGACPASEGRDSDLGSARFLLGNPSAYATALLPMGAGDLTRAAGTLTSRP